MFNQRNQPSMKIDSAFKYLRVICKLNIALRIMLKQNKTKNKIVLKLKRNKNLREVVKKNTLSKTAASNRVQFLK